MDVFENMNHYYKNYDEDGRLLPKHGQIEFLTTMRYIQKYLLPGMQVLEIGAGTGIYSHAIGRIGHEVDAIELIQHNIDIFKGKTSENETITIRQGNATDLSLIESNRYDISLLLGPMYHLFTTEDKIQALSEALRVTKTGGILFVSYCISDASIICYGFKGGNVSNLIERGLLDPETFKTHSNPSDIFDLTRKEDIDELMENFNVTRLHYVATDLATNYMRETVNTMDDEIFSIYLKYHFSICERPDMVGATHHSLDIFKKNEG